LMLHDLQELGSLTTIWYYFSDTWDNKIVDISLCVLIVVSGSYNESTDST
jgi:hypothetical protein